MKATAQAPANIAFIKYWGKKDAALRLPLNASLSMNLSEAYTTTTVEFSSEYTEHQLVTPVAPFHKIQRPREVMKWETMNQNETGRVFLHIDRMQKLAGVVRKAKIATVNSFPTGAGIASSASGFAALTVATAAALKLSVSEKELSELARLGSGSACRSVPDGFVLWEEGTSSATSYAHSIFPHDWWDLRDVVIVVSSNKKETSSASGMDQIITSPKLPHRIAAVPGRMKRAIAAIADKNIRALGEVIEEDCFDMHAVMQSQVPPLSYWTEETNMIVSAVHKWRKGGLAVYYTIDAGPNVHLICEGKNEQLLLSKVKELSGVERVIVNKPAPGAHLINAHLF